MMRTCCVSLALILVARTPSSLRSTGQLRNLKADIKDYSYFFIGQVKSSALRDLSTLMKTLAIKSLTGTPQAKVLSKNSTTQGPMRDWVLAFLGRKEHARDQA